MTSTEKVAEIRRGIAAAAAAGEPGLATIFGTWRLVRPIVMRAIGELEIVQVLDDPAALDDLLGLIAGVALELRSDFEPVEDEPPGWNRIEEIVQLRAAARELLEQVRPAA